MRLSLVDRVAKDETLCFEFRGLRLREKARRQQMTVNGPASHLKTCEVRNFRTALWPPMESNSVPGWTCRRCTTEGLMLDDLMTFTMTGGCSFGSAAAELSGRTSDI